MKREELLELRNKEQQTVSRLRKLGDFDASAQSVREAHESILQLCDHLLSRMLTRDQG